MHKGYKCFENSTKKTFISRHVLFDETSFPFFTCIPESTSSPGQSEITSLPAPTITEPATSPDLDSDLVEHTNTEPPEHLHHADSDHEISFQSLPPITRPSSSAIVPLGHSMTTRSRLGIHKPKYTFLILSHTILSPVPSLLPSLMRLLNLMNLNLSKKHLNTQSGCIQ